MSNVKILNTPSDLRSKYSLYVFPHHMKVSIYISAFYYDKEQIILLDTQYSKPRIYIGYFEL